MAQVVGSPFFGAVLHIDYQRICPSDRSGMVNIDCDGPLGWSYADVGSHHGIQIAEGVDEAKIDDAIILPLLVFIALRSLPDGLVDEVRTDMMKENSAQ